MPRKSPEDRVGSYWRVGGKPPPPPDVMSLKAKHLWRKIVNARAHDYFESASLELLAQFCELCITQRINLDMIRRDAQNPEFQRMAARLQAVINSLQ
jgi:hypothetical protein